MPSFGNFIAVMMSMFMLLLLFSILSIFFLGFLSISFLGFFKSYKHTYLFFLQCYIFLLLLCRSRLSTVSGVIRYDTRHQQATLSMTITALRSSRISRWLMFCTSRLSSPMLIWNPIRRIGSVSRTLMAPCRSISIGKVLRDPMALHLFSWITPYSNRNAIGFQRHGIGLSTTTFYTRISDLWLSTHSLAGISRRMFRRNSGLHGRDRLCFHGR